MLFPALNRARKTAFSAGCVSNQKTLAAANAGYINDYDGFYVPSQVDNITVTPPSGKFPEENRWHYTDLPASYLGNNEVNGEKGSPAYCPGVIAGITSCPGLFFLPKTHSIKVMAFEKSPFRWYFIKIIVFMKI